MSGSFQDVLPCFTGKGISKVNLSWVLSLPFDGGDQDQVTLMADFKITADLGIVR